MVEVKIINQSENALPAYQTNGSAGLDLCARLEADVEIMPLQRAIIPTGIFLEIPEGFEAQIRPRSGLAAKFGLTVLNSPGTIDSDYRGEIKVILVNLSNQPFVVKSGERIAQMVFASYIKAQLKEVQELNDTQRGTGGFGHTGK